MIFADIILEALTPPPVGPVVVKGHVRARPFNAKREAVLEELRALRRLRSSVPSQPEVTA